MTEPIGYLLAQAFQLPAGQSVKTTDDRAGGVATDRAIPAGWYRTRLAPAAGAATETDPQEFLRALMVALDLTRWTFALTAAGLVQITYTGAGTGTLGFTAGQTVRNILGFDTNTIGPLASNSTYTGTYLPTHCLFAYAAESDTGWVDLPSRFAGSALPGGVVYGWHDGRVEQRRTALYSALPRTWALRSTLNASGTPAHPVTSRWLSPATGEPAQAPPWSVLDTHATAAGKSCGVCWGTFEDIIGGGVTTYDVVYMAPEQFTAGAKVSLWRPGYDARRSFSIELLYAGVGAL